MYVCCGTPNPPVKDSSIGFVEATARRCMPTHTSAANLSWRNSCIIIKTVSKKTVAIRPAVDAFETLETQRHEERVDKTSSEEEKTKAGEEKREDEIKGQLLLPKSRVRYMQKQRLHALIFYRSRWQMIAGTLSLTEQARTLSLAKQARHATEATHLASCAD